MPHDIFADSWYRDSEALVECIHCGRVFKLGDAVWIEAPEDPVITGLWSCAYYPECDGTLIDFVRPGDETVVYFPAASHEH